MPGFFGVQLPAYRAPSPIDFSPLSEGLDALGKTIEKNRLLDQAKAVGEALRSGQTTNADGTATTHPQVNQLLSPLYPTPESVKASPAQASAAAAGRDYPSSSGNMDQYAKSISGIESGSFKNPYTAVGPTVKGGDRALGKYQVMQSNIGPWTKEVLGREMTPQEFLANPQAQDAVFNAKFGQYVAKTGNPQDAASMWFTGRPAAQSGDARARDANGNPIGITGREYVAQFNAGLGQQPAAQSAAAQSATIQPVSAPASQNYGAGIDMALKQGNLALATQLMQQQRAEQSANQQNQLFPYQLQEAQFGADKNRVALENAATQQLGVLANTIQQAPAGAQAGMWQRIIQTHPEMAATLQQHGVDPNDVAAGTSFFINQAQGIQSKKDLQVVPAGASVITPQGQPVFQAPQNNGKNMQQIAELRKEYNTQSKDFQIQLAGADRVAVGASSNTPQGDIALVYGFMKMLDPTSVVREGEYATAENAGGIPQRVWVMYNKALTGERLTPEMRQAFVKQSADQVKIARKRQDAINKRYSDIAQRNGFAPEDIVTTFAPSPGMTAEGISAPSGTSGAIETPRLGPNDKAKYDALPSGAKFVDPEGNERTKP